ncbi:DoxX family protein [Leifsonia sp. Leaf264]|uniref:DoxX family protein n=1 Tax=Leifsonia sp. Leaf264 TaxID=1736314 RepID=UPI003FA5F888
MASMLASRFATSLTAKPHPSTTPQLIGRIALGAALLFAGISHLTFARQDFQAQVPDWVPADKDFVVIASGIVEITLGGALIVLGRRRIPVGWVVAAFFVAVFPGNISQYVTRTDAFGLDTDTARGIRLVFQPLLVLWALWSTGAIRALRRK